MKAYEPDTYFKRPFHYEIIVKTLDALAGFLGQSDHHGLYLKWIFDTYGSSDVPETVVDVGAGTGVLLSYKSDKVNRRVAIDFNDKYQKLCNSKGIDFFTANLEKDTLPLPDASTYLVMTNHVIEHITNQKHFMSELIRILKPGGLLLVRTPDIKRIGKKFWDTPDHVTPFNKNDLEKALKSAGMDVIFIENFSYPLFSASPFIFFWPIHQFFGEELIALAKKR